VTVLGPPRFRAEDSFRSRVIATKHERLLRRPLPGDSHCLARNRRALWSESWLHRGPIAGAYGAEHPGRGECCHGDDAPRALSVGHPTFSLVCGISALPARVASTRRLRGAGMVWLRIPRRIRRYIGPRCHPLAIGSQRGDNGHSRAGRVNAG